VLSRAAWRPRTGARLLLGLPVDAFAPSGPVALALDDTIGRRWGRRIRARGIHRDPVRSSDAHLVKTSGPRWISLMLLPLAPVPRAGRVRALPFLTALVPSERSCRERGRRHKALLDVGRGSLPCRRGAGWEGATSRSPATAASFSALLFLDAMRRGGVTAITRLRLDAALHEPAAPRLPGTVGRPRTEGARLPTLSEALADESTSWQPVVVPGWPGAGERALEVASATAAWRHGGLPVVPIRWVLVRDPEHRFATQALLCTDPAQEPARIIAWFVRRWQVEVTFQAVRAHLGVETQRQWSDTAIARTTPCLLALFSIVTLLAARCTPPGPRAAADRRSGVVPQTAAHLQRRARRRSSRDLARAGFGGVTSPRREDETPPLPASTVGPRPPPRRLNGQSRA
jgi:hypothetical protein